MPSGGCGGHWERAFEIVNMVPDGLTLPAGSGQGGALLRRVSSM